MPLKTLEFVYKGQVIKAWIGIGEPIKVTAATRG